MVKLWPSQYKLNQLYRASESDLEAALRFSRINTTSDPNKIVMIGGGPSDKHNKEYYSPRKLVIAGLHNDGEADIKKDWNSDDFWNAIEDENPSAIIIDRGSDCWLSLSAATRIKEYTFTKRIPLIFSIRKDATINEDVHYMDLVDQSLHNNYAMRVCSAEFFLESDIVFMFHHSFLQHNSAGEVLRELGIVFGELRSGSKTEAWNKAYEWITALGNVADSCEDATKLLLELVLPSTT